MPPELAGVVWLIAGTVLPPGIGLLALARFGFGRTSGLAADALRGVAQKLGFTLVVLVGMLFAYLLATLSGGPRAGGLGSMGNPLGSILVFGYLFVLAPLAVVAAVTVFALYTVRRRAARGG